jgi:hypothetical protein
MQTRSQTKQQQNTGVLIKQTATLTNSKNFTELSQADFKNLSVDLKSKIIANRLKLVKTLFINNTFLDNDNITFILTTYEMMRT